MRFYGYSDVTVRTKRNIQVNSSINITNQRNKLSSLPNSVTKNHSHRELRSTDQKQHIVGINSAF